MTNYNERSRSLRPGASEPDIIHAERAEAIHRAPSRGLIIASTSIS
jgi:hypothetical protein